MEGVRARRSLSAMILAESSRSRLLSGDVRAGAYVTDGFRLLRVVRGFAASLEDVAVLEDCRTLEHSCHAADEVWRMGLSLVRPAERPF
jgi:hypothetical protein